MTVPGGGGDCVDEKVGLQAPPSTRNVLNSKRQKKDSLAVDTQTSLHCRA